MATKRIALIICSTRKPRVCPAIAEWVSALISAQTTSNTTLTTIDLLDYPLPISPSGTTIPAKVKFPLAKNPYEDKGVNVWSRTVRGFDAFILLTPQYNWSFPASIKVALDHLFYEWARKPMITVTYGGHGGGKANAALREVWKGLRGGECVAGVELATEGEGMGRAQREGVLDEGIRKAWEESGKDGEVKEGWTKLVEALGGES